MSWLDHVVCTGTAHRHVLSCDTLDDISFGDHIPVQIVYYFKQGDSCMLVFVRVSKRYKVYKQHQSIETSDLFSRHAGSVALVIMSTGSVAPAIMSN